MYSPSQVTQSTQSMNMSYEQRASKVKLGFLLRFYFWEVGGGDDRWVREIKEIAPLFLAFEERKFKNIVQFNLTNRHIFLHPNLWASNCRFKNWMQLGSLYSSSKHRPKRIAVLAQCIVQLAQFSVWQRTSRNLRKKVTVFPWCQPSHKYPMFPN